MRGILRGSVVSLKQAGPDVGDAKPLLGTVECKALKIAAAPTDSQGLENETLSQFRKDDAPWGDEGSPSPPQRVQHLSLGVLTESCLLV